MCFCVIMLWKLCLWCISLLFFSSSISKQLSNLTSLFLSSKSKWNLNLSLKMYMTLLKISLSLLISILNLRNILLSNVTQRDLKRTTWFVKSFYDVIEETNMSRQWMIHIKRDEQQILDCRNVHFELIF